MFAIGLKDLIVRLLITAVMLWGLSQCPLDATMMKVIRVILIVVAVVWVIVFLAGLIPDVPLSHPVTR